MKNNSEMLGEEKITTLLLKLSIPAIVGMIVQALYNVVDTIFVGQGVGIMAIAALSIAFPIQMLMMAIAQMAGIGGASIISRSLGANDIEKAEKTMGNVFALVLIMSGIGVLLGTVFVEPILRLFGATEEILPLAAEYITIILRGTIFFSFAMASNNIIRSEGNARVAMGTMLISGGLNILLDPIFIFDTIPLLNIPGLNMGIRGAATATVIAQMASFFYIVFYFLRGKSVVAFRVKNLKLDFKIIREITSVGLSSFIRQIAASLLAIVLNNSLAIYSGEMAIAVYGVINRLLMFSIMPILGIVQGLQPIIGYNYGAKKPERVQGALKLGIGYATALSTFAFLILMFFPKALIAIFNNDTALNDMGVHALRIVVLALPLVGFQAVGSGYFQAIGRALPALITSMSRQILFLIPLVLALPLLFGLEGIWAAFPVADALSVFLTYIMFMRAIKEQKEIGTKKNTRAS